MVAMEVAAHPRIQLENHMTEGFVSRSMELKWVRRRISKSSRLEKRKLLLTSLFPIYISTDPRHVDPQRLRDLYANCNHSCHRFPNDVVEPVDIRKLRIALSHSAVLVSVFCKPHDVVAALADTDADDEVTSTVNSSSSMMGMAGFLQSVTPVTPSDGELVGFGRAVSDCGLTASIYDVMVIPSLRRMGIGQMIVKKMVRMLRNREIYDIAALCSENERLFMILLERLILFLCEQKFMLSTFARLFFKACGFGGDILSSTTMMYTRTASPTTQEGEQTITRAGRKLLLIPPLKGLHKSSRTII